MQAASAELLLPSSVIAVERLYTTAKTLLDIAFLAASSNPTSTQGPKDGGPFCRALSLVNVLEMWSTACIRLQTLL